MTKRCLGVQGPAVTYSKGEIPVRPSQTSPTSL